MHEINIIESTVTYFQINFLKAPNLANFENPDLSPVKSKE